MEWGGEAGDNSAHAELCLRIDGYTNPPLSSGGVGDVDRNKDL